MNYQLNGMNYEIIIEKKRNKHIYMRVKEDGKIHVSCPMFTSKRHIMDLILANEEALSNMARKREKSTQKNEEFYYFGKKYDIIVVSGLTDILVKEDYIYTPSKKDLDLWLKYQEKEIFEQHYRHIYHQFEEQIGCPRLRMRTMKTRWGVCNKKSDTITLNTNLIHYPVACLDYVIVHEFCHLVFFDHSKNFWNLVSKYCPNYKEIRKILKE